MIFWVNLITIISLVTIPLYCIYRINKSKYTALLNPSLHLLIWGYAYFIFPIFLMPENPLFRFFKLSDTTYQETSLLCNWYVFIFFIYYLFSSDKKIESTDYYPKPITYDLSIFFTALTSAIFIFLVFKFGAELWGIESRSQALRTFSINIFEGFKYPVLLNLFIASVSVIAWRTRSFYSFLLIPLAISLDLLAKGRMVAWTYLFFAYINYVSISKKAALKVAIPIFTLLVSTVFFRLSDTNKDLDLMDAIGLFFSDQTNTFLGALLYYQDYVGKGNLVNYLLFSFFQFLPNAFTLSLFDYSSQAETTTSFTVDLDYINKIGYSLANNIVGESLYYGGIEFAIISPLIIGGIIYGLYKFRVFKTFPGFIFMCFVIASLRGTVRGNFYSSFLQNIWLMYSYLIWLTLLEWGRTVFQFKQDSEKI